MLSEQSPEMLSEQCPEMLSEQASLNASSIETCVCFNSKPLSMVNLHVPDKVPIDTKKTPIVWVLGGPGCGKGTQCTKIIERYGFTHLSTGDLLRDEVAKGNENASYLSKLMKEGLLVPTEYVLALLKQEIQVKAATTRGFLVDGYPRKKSQGMAFEESIASPNAIIFFEMSHESLMDRMRIRAATSGRFDDNEVTIKLRMKTFYKHNPAVMEQYAKKISLINGESSVDVIFADVVKVMDPIVFASAAN